MFLILAMLAPAWAHGPACPPSPMLRARVAHGPLSPPDLACAREAELEGVVLLDRLHREPAAAAGDARGYLASAPADDALAIAELLQVADPEVAALAAARARARASEWEAPQGRAGKAARLLEVEATLDPAKARAWAQGVLALGVVGEPLERARQACPDCDTPVLDLPPPRSPDAEDLVACRDLGRLWTAAHAGNVYGTERDCLVRATEVLEGEARATAARLALLLALRHRDREAALVVAHRVADALPGDPGVSARVASLHAELGDPTGAAWWEARARSHGSR